MKFVALALVACLAVAAASPLSENQYQYLFTRWVDQYNRQYEAADFFVRYDTFKTNLNRVIEHNNKGLSWSMAMNEFGDMTPAEFKAKMTGLFPRPKSLFGGQRVAFNSAGVNAPSSIDWRSEGKVTPVKNQGQCGSCWAFSAVAALESLHAIKNGKLVGLSEQQLVDCAGSTGNAGCNGGLMDLAFKWIINNRGICSEDSYKYTARDGACQKTCTPVVQVSNFVDIPIHNETAILQAVAAGPISIAIEADRMSFQFYSGGVFDDASCGTDLDHGVAIVGYGTESGKDYWIVRNSWGSSWGESGYIRMVRNKNQCGLSEYPSYPIVV